MYTPTHFLETDSARLAALIRDNAFGTLISVTRGRTTVSHVPFLHDPGRNLLRTHLAHANPHWEELADADEVLAIFHGPHAYVSPTWYSSPGVPTWNYAVVHVHGTATTYTDPDALAALVGQLAGTYESTNPQPWPGNYSPKMLGRIVGVDIRITDIQGKFKLSQNRPADDRRAVAAALRSGGSEDGARLAELMAPREHPPAAGPQLDTRRLCIDALRPADAGALFRYRSLPEVAKFQSWCPRSEADAESFIAKSVPAAFDQPGTWYQLALRLKSDGALVGDLGLHFLDGDPAQMEVGITVAPSHQRQGIAGEALAAVLDHAFGELGKHRVTASVDPGNEASRQLLERLGFRQEAHFRQSLYLGGEWVDDVVYAALKSEWRT